MNRSFVVAFLAAWSVSTFASPAIGRDVPVVGHLLSRAVYPGAVFAGKPYESGGGADRLNDPQGVATDAEGNLYVADVVNRRVVAVRFEHAAEASCEIPRR